MSPNELTRLARTIATRVRCALTEEAQSAPAGETLADPDDLKSTHDVDRLTAHIAAEHVSDLPCNIFVEGEADALRDDARFSIYIDPIDGSLNWDRGIGDPAFVMAMAETPRIARLGDLQYAYVEGLRTGDVYFIDDHGRAIHDNARTGRQSVIDPAGPAHPGSSESLAMATGYLRPGYGMAEAQLGTTLALYLAARDIRAVDNAAMELCEIARGAGDFMVEARGCSDGFNLIAWPVLRSIGGVLWTLDGRDLTDLPFDPGAPVDYIAAANETLAKEIGMTLEQFAPHTRQSVAALARDISAWYRG